MKTKLEKTKKKYGIHKTCKDCCRCRYCLESDRMYPCIDFKERKCKNEQINNNHRKRSSVKA